MNFKKIATTIELLAITSVISVGFSAWTIVENFVPTVSATIETENVINTGKYIEIKNIAFSDYCDGGFYPDFTYTEDSTQLLSYAYLYADININLIEWNELNSNESFSKLKFSLDIISDELSGMVTKLPPSRSHTYTTSTTQISGNVTNIINGWNDSFEINYTDTISALSFLNINLMYKITPDTLSNFINLLKNSAGSGISIKFLVEMSGGN